MENNYDFFISYSTPDKEIAFSLVNNIEAHSKKCFIAPRNIRTGYDYASEIIRGIQNSSVVLIVFSDSSNKSPYCLREINSAVGKCKKIIPLKIDQCEFGEAMEFYLGTAHWVDATKGLNDEHIKIILDTLDSINVIQTKDSNINGNNTCDLTISSINDALLLGISSKDILMKEIELDYLNVPNTKYFMNEDINGSFSDWEDATTQYEIDTSCLVLNGKGIVGYCDFYPIDSEYYPGLISGQYIIRDSMIALYDLGGTFDAYIAMIALNPELMNQKNYLLIFQWIKTKIINWKKEGIIIRKIGISVYNSLLEKFAIKLGFTFKASNPAKGKIYETDSDSFLSKF